MFFKFFFILCLTVYIISLVEVVGSYFVTEREHGSSTDVNLIFSVFCPPAAPFVTLAIYATAHELYSRHAYNTYSVDESFYGFILHGFRTINQWSFKK